MTDTVDLIVVGAGPTGLAIGAEARQADLSVLLLDRGPLTANLLEFPTYMTFFTTRDRLEIAGIPFAVPEAHPSVRQALVYYRAVATAHELPLALHEEVSAIHRSEDGFEVQTRRENGPDVHHSRAVALATGYFHNPRRLGVPGEDAPWVQVRYRDPYRHYGQKVLIVGGGNSAVEAALELWRAGVDVVVVHRGAAVRPTVKYWIKPDFENRVAEGSIEALFEHRVTAFEPDHRVTLEGPEGKRAVHADAAIVLIGYQPDAALQRESGVRVDAETLVPTYDPDTCESNVPGLYLAGSLHCGVDTNKIFIENARRHAPKIVRHLSERLSAEPVKAGG
jgi:thioredoxin reductase (NADPH)